MDRIKAVNKLDLYIQRLIKKAQAEISDPAFRQQLATIEECYGREWGAAVRICRMYLETGTEEELRERAEQYSEKAQAYRLVWYDEDWQECRDGDQVEAGFYETLADICRTAYEEGKNE